MRLNRVLTLLAGALFVASCGTAAEGPAASTTRSGAPASAITELRTTSTAVGMVVSDGNGMTLYLFTKDTQGTTSSACTGQCLATWPPAIAGAELPKVTGVTGKVATIDTADGRRQLTLSGWPLYYFANDSAPGAVLGQGVGNVWYVLDPAGNPVKTAVGDAPGGGY